MRASARSTSRFAAKRYSSPYMTLDVTTPAGQTTYTDDFYSCMGGGGPFVENIDGVFSALRQAAN